MGSMDWPNPFVVEGLLMAEHRDADRKSYRDNDLDALEEQGCCIDGR